MTDSRIDPYLNSLINRIDELINSLKAIKNYRYDNMCVDYLRSLNKERATVYNQWEKLYNMTKDDRDGFDIVDYTNKVNKRIDGLYQTLLYLQSRPVIKNPY